MTSDIRERFTAFWDSLKLLVSAEVALIAVLLTPGQVGELSLQRLPDAIAWSRAMRWSIGGWVAKSFAKPPPANGLAII